MNHFCIVLLTCAVLAGCERQTLVAPMPSHSAAAPSARAATARAQKVGKIDQVEVEAEGRGASAGAALGDALQNAIQQVNGVTWSLSATQVTGYAEIGAHLDAADAGGADVDLTVRGSAYEQRVDTLSNGVVSRFKVLSLRRPIGAEGLYRITIKASVSEFMEPVDSGRLRIVVAPLRTSRASFAVGGTTVPATVALSQLRRAIIDQLTRSDRFIILDREFDDELASELGVIGSGLAPAANLAKMGKALSADLLLVGEVDTIEFQSLGSAGGDKAGARFQGKWAMTQRMINLATREINQASTLAGAGIPVAAPAEGAAVDAPIAMRAIREDLAKKSATAVLHQFYPVSVVSRSGADVVLSQGAAALAAGTSYRVYLQGRAMTDPQTGQSLDREEKLCCEVVVGRVAETLSYGKLTNVVMDLEHVESGALRIREAVIESAQAATPKTVPNMPRRPARRSGDTQAGAVAAASTARAADREADW